MFYTANAKPENNLNHAVVRKLLCIARLTPDQLSGAVCVHWGQTSCLSTVSPLLSPSLLHSAAWYSSESGDGVMHGCRICGGDQAIFEKISILELFGTSMTPKTTNKSSKTNKNWTKGLTIVCCTYYETPWGKFVILDMKWECSQTGHATALICYQQQIKPAVAVWFFWPLGGNGNELWIKHWHINF